jgi:hypothetical protein
MRKNAMTMNEVDRTVVTSEPAVAADQATPPAATPPAAVRTETRSTSMMGPGGNEVTRRVVVLLFGLVQIVIGLRFVLLLLNAREANDIVSGILNISQFFVAPFDGILQRDALHMSGSTFDVTAVVAFVGFTILELIVLWAVGIFRRERA